MSLVLSYSSLAAPTSHINPFNECNLKYKGDISKPYFFVSHHNFLPGNTKNIHKLSENKPFTILSPVIKGIKGGHQSFTEESTLSFDWEDLEEIEDKDTESPWEGAVIYKRNPSITHIEYCSTLERLGLGRLSTEISKSRASVMGLRVTKAVKDYPRGTPVQISVDVTRKKQKLRLDGIIRTIITLGCNRCGEPAAECVFSDFSLLLSEEPIEEPEIINIGKDSGEEKLGSVTTGATEDEDDEASIDWDDRLYFPPEVKEIDISKHIRDIVHLEITINAVCDPMCKGICLKCGANLNTSSCKCGKEEVKKEKGDGPLGNLRKQMQQKR